MVSSSATFAKSLLVLVLVPALPTVCRGDATLATKDDIASLSSLLRELCTSKQGSTQQDGWRERVAAVEATLRSTEATVNRLLDENAQLKASLNLIEEMFSQQSQLQDVKTRLSILEASKPEDAGDNLPKCVGDSNGEGSNMVDAGPAECSSPFMKVMGRCVFADSSVSGLWRDMRQHCRNMGADMVVIDSADFMWYLVRHLKEHQIDNVSYWVGAHRESTTGPFHWVDGTPIKTGTPFWGHHNNYKNPQPYDNDKELGVCMWNTGMFFLHSCGNTHVQSVICQRK